MKVRPILFSGPMVRAILEGRKTQTRRVVKPQPPSHAIEVFDWQHHNLSEAGCYFDDMDGLHFHCKRPYGNVGDRLWVRETWQYASGQSNLPVTDKPPCYRADGEYLEGYRDRGLSWQPSIFMPRWASRITLEITEIRVEKLQMISGLDVLAEGIDNGHSNPTMGVRWENMQRMAWVEFLQKLGHMDWNANPWVWVIEFSRVEN
jgi:hypothetical protein